MTVSEGDPGGGPTIEDVLALADRYKNWGRWGDSDELGTLNFVTSEMRARAAAEVTAGKVFSLALPFDSSGPQRPGGQRFNPIHLMFRDGGDFLSGAYEDYFYGGVDKHLRAADDMIIMPLQCGTQWDALAHIAHNGQIYNGYSSNEISSFGAKRNSIMAMKDQLFGRGVLLDVARAKGERWLEPGTGISSSDLDAACETQGVVVGEGDFVFVRTGQVGSVKAEGAWGDYAGGPAPGLNLDSLEWLWRKKIAAIVTDTWGFEVRPNETPEVFQPLHIVAVVYMGLTIGEMFDLEELAEDCAVDGRYSFLFSGAPLTISGAVGSPVNPLAIK
jgi:kynurenine formamidase